MAVIVVVGARPNFFKAKPIVDALGDRAKVVHVGQHKGNMVADTGLRVDNRLQVNQLTPERRLGEMIMLLSAYFAAEAPEAVVVVGDVDTTLAGALAAHKARIPLVHYESGLRSGDWTMPEEANRMLVDEVSDLLLCTTAGAKANLTLGRQKIVVVGNTMIDTLQELLPRSGALRLHRAYGVQRRQYVLVTTHRPALVDNHPAMVRFASNMERLAQEWPVVWIEHPRVDKALYPAGAKGITMVPPLPHGGLVSLLLDCGAVITDSGGVQEEAAALGIPCMVARTSTERPETLHGNGGSCFLTPNDYADMAAMAVERGSRYEVPKAMWADGRSGPRAADAILTFLDRE